MGLKRGGEGEGLAEHSVTQFMCDSPLPCHTAGDTHAWGGRQQGTPTPARLGSRGNQPLLGQVAADEFIFGEADLQRQVFSTSPSSLLLSFASP